MQEKIYTVCFMLGDKAEIMKLYSLYSMNDIDKPITFEGKIVFAKTLKGIKGCLPFCGVDYIGDIHDTGFEVNPVEAINILLNSKNDSGSVVLSCLNTYVDFIRAVNIEIDPQVKDKLYKFLDFVTFNTKQSEFFHVNKDIKVNEIIDFIHWGTGIILNNSIIYRSVGRQSNEGLGSSI